MNRCPDQGDRTPEEDSVLEGLRFDYFTSEETASKSMRLGSLFAVARTFCIRRGLCLWRNAVFPPIDSLDSPAACHPRRETDDGRDPPSSVQFEDVVLDSRYEDWSRNTTRQEEEFKALLHWATALQRKAFSSLRRHSQEQRDNERRASRGNAPWSESRCRLVESRERRYVAPSGKDLLVYSSLNGAQRRRSTKPPSHRRSTVQFRSESGRKSLSPIGGIPLDRSHLARRSFSFRFGERDRKSLASYTPACPHRGQGSVSSVCRRPPTAFVDCDTRRMRPVQSIASVKEYHAIMYSVASVIDDMVCSIENA